MNTESTENLMESPVSNNKDLPSNIVLTTQFSDSTFLNQNIELNSTQINQWPRRSTTPKIDNKNENFYYLGDVEKVNFSTQQPIQKQISYHKLNKKHKKLIKQICVKWT